MTATLKWGLSLVGLVLVVLAGGLLAGQDPGAIDPAHTLALPTLQHWFGTDELGRDLLSRLAMGAWMSLLIGVATAGVSVGLGTLYGIVAALSEGTWLDALMMRCLDILYSLPGLMMVILVNLFLKNTMMPYLPPASTQMLEVVGVVFALSLFSWPDTARIIRGEVTRIKREEFIEAFYSLGGNRLHLIWRHLVPNVLPFMVLSATITIPRAILTESTLSFIGLGVAPPFSSWGTMMGDGWQVIRMAPHLVVLPSVMLIITMSGLNFMGEGLKQTLRKT